MHYRTGMMIAAVACSALFTPVDADQRSFAWTYEYLTMPRGQWELEHYLTFSTPRIGSTAGNTGIEHQIELEVGMNDRLDFGIYQVFTQSPAGDLRYKGFKLRERYRFSEEGKLFVDPLLYLEYKGVPDFSKHAGEFKVILARTFASVAVSVNPILEVEYEKGAWEVTPEYAAGVTWRAVPRLGIGLEFKGSPDAHYIGPTISHGGEKAWAVLGSAFRMGKGETGSNAMQIRLLMGIQP